MKLRCVNRHSAYTAAADRVRQIFPGTCPPYSWHSKAAATFNPVSRGTRTGRCVEWSLLNSSNLRNQSGHNSQPVPSTVRDPNPCSAAPSKPIPDSLPVPGSKCSMKHFLMLTTRYSAVAALAIWHVGATVSGQSICRFETLNSSSFRS